MQKILSHETMNAEHCYRLDKYNTQENISNKYSISGGARFLTLARLFICKHFFKTFHYVAIALYFTLLVKLETRTKGKLTLKWGGGQQPPHLLRLRTTVHAQ